jgi:hypothetical protein
MITVGAAFIGLIVLVAHKRTENTGQPRYQNAAPEVGLNVMAVDSLDTGDHYFHPNYCVPGQTQIWTAHRYPAVSGGNISTLIHHGMDRLKVPAPQDDDWIKNSPAEVMF